MGAPGRSCRGIDIGGSSEKPTRSMQLTLMGFKSTCITRRASVRVNASFPIECLQSYGMGCTKAFIELE